MSGNNNQGDPAFLLVIVCLMMFGMGWLFWHSTQDFWVAHLFRWLRFGEIGFINLFTHQYGGCLDWLRQAQVGVVDPNLAPAASSCFGDGYLGALPVDEREAYFKLSMPPLMVMGAEAERYYRWLIAPVMAAIAYFVLFKSPRNKFMTKHTLETFIETQAKMWPVITPIVKLNPSKTGRILGGPVPDKLPLFAEALSPEEWVSFNRIPLVNGIPDRDITRRAFIQQLGPRWTGIDNAPAHIRALFAAFAVRGAQKREESDDLLGRLALAWTPEKGFRMDGALESEVSQFIRDPEIGGKALAVADQFAWRTTAMIGVLQWARTTGGVLAPAQFLWLRGHDRALWYPLNNLGRRSFHSEGAGAMAHYMAEQAAQKPLPIPRVDNAYSTLHTYLHDPEKKSVPIPPRAKA